MEIKSEIVEVFDALSFIKESLVVCINKGTTHQFKERLKVLVATGDLNSKAFEVYSAINGSNVQTVSLIDDAVRIFNDLKQSNTTNIEEFELALKCKFVTGDINLDAYKVYKTIVGTRVTTNSYRPTSSC